MPGSWCSSGKNNSQSLNPTPTLQCPSSIIEKLGPKTHINNFQIDKPRGGKYTLSTLIFCAPCIIPYMILSLSHRHDRFGLHNIASHRIASSPSYPLRSRIYTCVILLFIFIIIIVGCLRKSFAFFLIIELYIYEPDVLTLAWYHTCYLPACTRLWDIDWLIDWVNWMIADMSMNYMGGWIVLFWLIDWWMEWLGDW